MNVIQRLLCFSYENIEDCPVSNHASIIGTALVGLGLVAIVFSKLPIWKWDCQKLALNNADAVNELNVQGALKPADAVNELNVQGAFKMQEDRELFASLCQTWHLSSEVLLFDLWGVDFYRSWKETGAASEDLDFFCELCNDFSLSLTMCAVIDNLQLDISPYINKMRDGLSSLSNKIPDNLQQKFQFIFKIFPHPQEVMVLGDAPLKFIEGGNLLDQGETNQEDIRDFLEFLIRADNYYSPLLKPSSSSGEATRPLRAGSFKTMLGRVEARPNLQSQALRPGYSLQLLSPMNLFKEVKRLRKSVIDDSSKPFTKESALILSQSLKRETLESLQPPGMNRSAGGAFCPSTHRALAIY